MSRVTLRIPLVLAVATIGAIAASTSTSCSEHGSSSDAGCLVRCVPSGMGSGSANCPGTTCATGSNLDQCPADCIPEPIV